MIASHPKNVAKAQAETAKAFQDRPALCFPDRTFTHAQISRLGAVFATRMAANGIGAESLIWIASGDVLVIIAAMLGAARIGAAVIQIGEGAELPDKLVVTHTLRAAEENAVARGVDVVVNQDWSPAKNMELDIQNARADAPWLYVHTSGTTGLPKFLALSQRMVVDRSVAVADDFPPDGKAVLLYPAGSRPWLARVFAALLNGGALYCGYPTTDWARHGISLVSGSRPQFQAMLDHPPKQKLARAEVIGALLPESEAIHLLDLFESVDDTFGSSETSKCYSTLWQKAPDGSAFAIGQRRDSTIEIVDSKGIPCPMGEFGILRIRNTYMVSGYVTDVASANDTFRDGWFYPGDIARQTANGRIQFRTRMDHIVNIRGEKVNAYAIDMIFRATPGIHDAVVFRNPKADAIDELFAFVVFHPNANRIQAIESAKYAVRERFGAALVPRIIRPVAGIPRSQDGSPDRKACADYVLQMAAGDGANHNTG